MYGSLKDYLKQLKMGNLAPLHPNTVRTSGERGGVSTGPCTCPCHSSCQEEGEGVAGGRGEGVNNTRQVAPPFSLYDSSQHDPAVLAHAARLMRLLDSDYYYQAARHGDGTEKESCGSDSSSDCTSVDRALHFGGGGMCAYHSDLEESPYRYRWMQQALSSSGYYNSQGSSRDASSVHTGSNGPLLLAPPYANLPSEGGASMTSMTSSCHCSDNASASVDVEYRNVTSLSGRGVTGSAIGSGRGVTGSAIGNGGTCGGRCKCPDTNMTRGQLSYFEVLDYATQISRGMEHLESMKVCHVLHNSPLLSALLVHACMQCLHRDLAARNVLIAEGFLLKIGDFGLSRQLASWKDYYRKLTPVCIITYVVYHVHTDDIHLQGKIPARWMALESLEERTHTSKSDV